METGGVWVWARVYYELGGTEDCGLREKGEIRCAYSEPQLACAV